MHRLAVATMISASFSLHVPASIAMKGGDCDSTILLKIGMSLGLEGSRRMLATKVAEASL